MRRAIGERGKDISVRSAGLAALIGHRADQDAQTVLRRRGLNLSEHRAVQVNRDMLHWANLVLVMEDVHRTELRGRDPDSAGKVLLLGHWIEAQIPDPFRCGLVVFEQTMDLIERAVASWTERI